MRTVEVVTSVLRFRELETPWSHLWSNAPTNAFQSYAWIAAWVAHKKSDYNLRIGLVWHADRLVAVLPMAVHRFHGLRILEWAAQCVTDYCDGLGEVADLQTAWNAVMQLGQIDLVRLKNIPRGAKAQFLADCRDMQFAEDEICLKMTFQHPSSVAWVKSFTAKRRTLYKRRRRLLDEIGTVEITHCDHIPDPALLDTLHRLKQTWLATHRQGSYLIDDGPDRLASLTRALAQIGRLHLSVMTCNGVVVAGSINIIHGDVFMVFMCTYDAEFSRVSPGSLLMFENMRWALDAGFRTIDYLRGVEDFKREWANAETILYWVIGVVTRRGRAALVLRRLMTASASVARRMNGNLRTAGSRLKTIVNAHRSVPT